MSQRLIHDIYRPRRPVVQNRVVSSSLPKTHTPSRTLKSHKKPHRKMRWVLAFAAVIITAGVLVRQFTSLTDKILPHIPVTEAAKQEVKPAVDTLSLKAQLDAIIAENPEYQIGIAYSDIKTPASLQTGVEAPFIAASTSKLLTATLFLSQVEDGLYALNDKVGNGTAKSQLELMIEDSDNDAWYNFNTLLTDSKLDEYAESIGLKNFSTIDNLCTAEDIATLLNKLYKRELLNDANTNLLLSFMQKASENQYIAAALPTGTKVYHKAGYLEDRAHDAAIIDDGKQPFTLVIFTKTDGDYDFIEGPKIFHKITDTVLAAYQS